MTSSRSFQQAAELRDPPDEGDGWDEWLTLFANRDEVAAEYASCLARGADWPHWRAFNGAILRRWSPAGLRYIKEKAWRIAER